MAIYSQLTSEQRYQIYALLKVEQTRTEIARVVGKHKSTISREIVRNSGERGYRPIQAQRLCEQRKQGKYKGRFSASDWHLIEYLLSAHQWSPEQICLRLKEDGILEISHERIYQHIILDKQTGGDLYTHLRERAKRRKRYGSGKERRGQIPNQVSIDERPKDVDARDEPGADWEGDLIIGSKHKQAIVTLVDRCTRYTYKIHLLKSKIIPNGMVLGDCAVFAEELDILDESLLTEKQNECLDKYGFESHGS